MLLTQEDVAEALGMDRTTYRNLEKGKARILNPHLESLAEVLQTSVLGLIMGNFSISDNQSPLLSDVQAGYQNKLEEKDSELQIIRENYEAKIAILEEQVSMLKGWLSAEKEINTFLRAQNKSEIR